LLNCFQRDCAAGRSFRLPFCFLGAGIHFVIP
jgi:hypothetical protein